MRRLLHIARVVQGPSWRFVVRFAVALVALVAAAVLILTGVAQRTFLKPPDRIRIAASVPADVDYVVLPSSVLRAHPGQQQLHLQGSGTVFAAAGRASDVTGWLAGRRYALLRVDAQGRMLPPAVRTAPALAGITASGSPDPSGSDLWLEQARRARALDWKVSLPASVWMVVASDGSAPAPSTVRLDWPVRASTPFAVPLIVGGGVLAVVGLLLYVWALVHVRRRVGPRRKAPPKMPRRPQPPKFRPQKPVPAGPGRGRRSESRSTVHRMLPATGLLLAAALVSTVSGPAPQASAADRDAGAAVSEGQALRIVQRAATTAARADAERDPLLAATRFTGPALALRTAAYKVRAKDKKAEMPAALPLHPAARDLRAILPQATDGWPRTLFVVVTDGSRPKAAPLALTLLQADPWADYKVQYAMELRPGTDLPTLPSALTGAARLDAQAVVLRVRPADLGAQYGSLLRDSQAPAASVFDTRGDPLIVKVGETARKRAAKKLGSTAGITYADLTGDPATVVALSTAASGALVSVDLEERTTVRPRSAGVKVQPSGGIRTLSKTSSTSKGIVAVYDYQLLFSVPSAGSELPVTLLGYAQGLVSAKEL